MKLVKLQCPNCNAKLEVNSEMKQFTCNYCGTTTMLDDESIKLEVSGTIKTSKLKNQIQDLKDLFDNGNYEETLLEANRLHELYPNNEEINKIRENVLAIKKQKEYEKQLEIERIKKEEKENRKKLFLFLLAILGIWLAISIISFVVSAVREGMYEADIVNITDPVFNKIKEQEIFKNYEFDEFEPYDKDIPSKGPVVKYTESDNYQPVEIEVDKETKKVVSIFFYCDDDEICIEKRKSLINAIFERELTDNDFSKFVEKTKIDKPLERFNKIVDRSTPDYSITTNDGIEIDDYKSKSFYIRFNRD